MIRSIKASESLSAIEKLNRIVESSIEDCQNKEEEISNAQCIGVSEIMILVTAINV